MGYPAKLCEDGLDDDVIDHSAEIKKWRTSFLFSLVTGVPVMVIMLYFMIDARVNPCEMDKHHNMTSSTKSGSVQWLVEVYYTVFDLVSHSLLVSHPLPYIL